MLAVHQSFSSQCSRLIPLKTSENLWFSDIFRGIKREQDNILSLPLKKSENLRRTENKLWFEMGQVSSVSDNIWFINQLSS